MATVFMKWLETKPESYDQGIRLLTLGRLEKVRREVLHHYIEPGMKVLEIGCGTGAFAALMAEKGAQVTAIDASEEMLSSAEVRLSQLALTGGVRLEHMDASVIGQHFEEGSFDRIVASLVFSELAPESRRYVLAECAHLLAPNGRLIIVDETLPQSLRSRILYYLFRIPLALLTWLLTRTSTSPLNAFEQTVLSAGLAIRRCQDYLGGWLILFELIPVREFMVIKEGMGVRVNRLRHQVTMRTLLLDLWTLFMRIVPPYPKVRPGLYSIGDPSRDSPVLVTGNFDLTVRRVVKALNQRLDAWLLVVNSAGINVWCAAGGGYLTAEKVISAVKACHLEEVVDHRALVLPQLCANGVDGWKVRQETRWGVHWGPVKAEDLPAYIAAKKKTDAMRWVRFPLKDRLEMVSATLGFYGLLILVPIFLFWRGLFVPVAISLICLSFFYAIFLPWLPGRDGLAKSIPLTILSLLGLLLYSSLHSPLPPWRMFNWSVGLIGLSVFVSAELQGMSPQMRGEQANWGWEAVIFIILALVYFLVPISLGWR